METKKVYAGIHAVTEDMSKLGIEKGHKNQQQGFTFRGIDDVLQALSPLMVKHRLVLEPTELEAVSEFATTAKGTIMEHTRVKMQYRFIHIEDGSEFNVTMSGKGMDSGDKALSKAQSMAFKYMAFQTFVIPLAGCDDADAESPQYGEAKAAPKPAPKAQPKAAPKPAAAPKAEPARAETDPWGDPPPPQEEFPETDRTITDDERKDLYNACRRSGMNDEAFRDMIKGRGFASSKDVTYDVYRDIMGKMKGSA